MQTFSTTFPQKITVFVNGNPFACLPNTSIAALLNYLDFDFRQTIVEYNSEIIKKEQLQMVQLQNKDTLEIITIVGGG